MDEENKEESSQEGLNKPKDEQGEKKPDSQETASNASESVKNTEEVIEELLANGTPAKKEVRIPYEKYREKDEKSKLFDQFSPILLKLKERPEVVDDLLQGKPLEPWQERVERIEEELNLRKQSEMKSALSDALKVWPNLKEQWGELRPMVEILTQGGISYREALRRSFIAVNPESAGEAEKLAGEAEAGRQGVFSSSAGVGKKVAAPQVQRYQMSPDDEAFAKMAGIDPALYEKYAEDIKKFS